MCIQYWKAYQKSSVKTYIVINKVCKKKNWKVSNFFYHIGVIQIYINNNFTKLIFQFLFNLKKIYTLLILFCKYLDLDLIIQFIITKVIKIFRKHDITISKLVWNILVVYQHHFLKWEKKIKNDKFKKIHLSLQLINLVLVCIYKIFFF